MVVTAVFFLMIGHPGLAFKDTKKEFSVALMSRDADPPTTPPRTNFGH